MSKMFLFHQDCPEGQLFNVETAMKNQDQLIADGWVDTPSLLDLPPKPIEASKAEIDAMTPDSIIALVRGMGFIVISEQELEAEVNKRVALLQDFTQELNQSDFESMTKDKLVEYAADHFQADISSERTKAAMIDKLKALSE